MRHQLCVPACLKLCYTPPQLLADCARVPGGHAGALLCIWPRGPLRAHMPRWCEDGRLGGRKRGDIAVVDRPTRRFKVAVALCGADAH